MYSNDNKKGFSILDLIVKIILAGLFIFILVWLFNKKVPNMKPFYSNVFRENIKYMQEAGENYFTDDKMPTEVGESRQLSLSEMIDKKLILPFVDEDGKDCNTKDSYVGITKLEEGYELKTNLVCPKESNYTIKMLGCHTYCANGQCNVVPDKEDKEDNCTVSKITQYQFKKLVKKTSSTYSCASGYKLKGKYCYKNTIIDTKPAEQSETTYRIDTKPATAVIISGKKVELATIVKTNTESANYNKNQLTTQKTTNTSGADYIVTQLTTQKSTNTSSYTCQKEKTERKCTTTYQSYSYTCNCTSSIGSTGKTVTTCSTCYGSVPVESCKNVTTTYNDTCYNSSTSYSCPAGTEYQTGSGSSLSCYKTSCPSGYSSTGTGKNRKCTKTSTTYSCPAGTTVQEGSGSSLKCYTTSCPSGYTATGSGSNLKCTKTTKTYSCPAEANVKEGTGASLKCYKVTDGSVSYKCEDSSYKLEGDKCTKRIEESSTKLECPSGYKLEGKVCNKYKTEEKKATETKTTTNKYEYKWSEKQSLSGWTFTGKTRTVNGKKVCK